MTNICSNSEIKRIKVTMGSSKSKLYTKFYIFKSLNSVFSVLCVLIIGIALVHAQGVGGDLRAPYPSPQAAPLVGQRQSRIPSQQVIVPGGFQHQLFPNQFSSLHGLDTGSARLLPQQQTPISIQNQQFAFLPRDPYGRALTGRAPTSASSLPSAKPTSSRSLPPNFVEIVSPNPQRLVSGNRGIGATGGSQLRLTNPTAQHSQLPGNNNVRNNADIQYEYYDETDGDVLYQYGNDFSDHPGGHTVTNPKQNAQYFTEISPPVKPVSTGQRNVKTTRNPNSSIRRDKPQSNRQGGKSTVNGGQESGSPSVASKSVITSGTSSRLYRPSRPTLTTSAAPPSAQAVRETSSSFIPLIDESEEPEQGLTLNGRSVQSSSRSNSLASKQQQATTLARPTTTLSTSDAETTAENSQEPSPSPQRPSSTSSAASTSSPSARRRLPKLKSPPSGSSSSSSRNRSTSGRGSGNNSTSGGRFSSATSRPPIIIRPRNLTRSRQNKSKDVVTASSTFRPDPHIDQSSEKPGNSLPSVEDYTVEYVEYPFNNEDNSSVVEYYEVSEETAQALLQRAKAKANLRKLYDHSSSPGKNGNTGGNTTASKVTVSVSSKSSYSSTSTTSTTSTTPRPKGIETSSSEENNSDQIDPSGEVVISVATTRSVSGKGRDVTAAPKQPVTATPKVTFSRATGSSFVVASVQTSRSVGKGHRPTKTTNTEGLKDSMPSGAETAPEYYEEEYTYPDNYPVLNNEGSLQRPEEPEDEQQTQQQENDTNEYSHEVSIHPPAISPTKSVISAELANAVSTNQFRESSDHSTSTVVKNSEENYDDEGSHAPQPRKLPSKKDDAMSHFQTLVDDVSELEVDHPLRPVDQEDLSPPPDDEASYHVAILPSPGFPSIITTTTTTTTPSPPPASSTTEKLKKDPASIFSSIRFAEISPDFLPPGFKVPSPSSSPEIPSTSSESAPSRSSTTTTTQPPPTASSSKPLGISFEEINLAGLLPKGYKPRPSVPKPAFPNPTLSTSSERPAPPTPTKAVDPLEALKNIVKFQEISIPGLVPKDYTPPPVEQVEPNVTSVLPGIRFETTSNLLPPGYKPPSEPVVPIKFETPANLLPKGYKPPASDSVEPIKFAVPANLLPPGYKPPSSASEASVPSSSTETALGKESVLTTKKPGGVVFPTKPGGARITRPSTTEPPKGDTPLPPAVRIATGWPTRKTTSFTGWPTIPTTPMPSTSSTTTTTTEAPSTTTKATTTTTTPPPKRSPPGSCPQDICRMEATIRIVGGVKWIPEFQDVNTDEYKHLETTVKRELDGAYRSSGLAPWYRKVEIEGFNRGSVIVDYFLLLDGIDRELSTDYVVRQFHKSLLDSADELPFYDESDSPDQLVSNGRLRFGRYTIDPRYTDFKVVNITKDSGPLAQDPLIPQWGIAVIVIGLASLLFVIIFGVTVLVNRHKNSKKKNAVSLTQEMLSEFNKSHMGSGAGGLDNYGADDLYNMDDVWNDKQMDKTFDRKPTKRSQGSGKGSANYNIYDSWKTEWNGYYYNGNYYGDSGYAPSRRRSDYDTNF